MLFYKKLVGLHCKLIYLKVDMRILFMLSRVPYPLIKGDKLRAYHHIKELSKHNEIILCALSDEVIHEETLAELNKYCHKIFIFKLKWYSVFYNILKALFNGKPLQVGYFYDKKINNAIDKIVKETKPDHIFCQLIRVSEYVKNYNIPKTIDYQDVFSKGVERRILTASFFMKRVFKLEHKRLLKYEETIFDCFDNRIIISKPDREAIPHKNKEEIQIVPNGVDQLFFKPKISEKKYDLIFTGNMAYPPNINAVDYLINKIIPVLVQYKPNIKILIAGAHPSSKIKKMQSENVDITGWVEDIRICYAQSKIFIAPMQIGTGLQNKLLEAMAMQLPCVSSEMANRALDATNGKEILLGHEPEEYVNHIIHLLDDKPFANEIALQGFKYVSENYNWEKLTDKINEIITK